MTKHLFLSSCCMVAMCLAGCGIKIGSKESVTVNGRTICPSGTVVTETRAATHFQGISAASGIKVSVAQSDSWKVVVEADENVIRFVSTEEVNGTLKIQYARDISIKDPVETKVKVLCPEIWSLSVSSAADIRTAGTINGECLSVNASSAGSISGALYYDEVSVKASSAALLRLSGKCITYRAQVSSGANADAFHLLSDRAYVEASSGSKATVSASDYLNAKASSGGSVIYFGNPAQIGKQTSSGGRVRQGR